MKVEKIRIFLLTNLNTTKQKDDSQGTPIILSNKMIHVPKNEGGAIDYIEEQYPFFTSSYKFPKDKLILKSYQERVKFFFDKVTFVNFLEAHDEEFQEKDKADTMRYNINTMIELLFTTVYPVINDNSESYNLVLNSKSTFDLSFRGTIPSFLKPIVSSLNVDFTYLKLNEQIYTVTSTCILNDFINHPKYSTLITLFSNFEQLKQDIKTDIKIQYNIIDREIYKIIIKSDNAQKIRLGEKLFNSNSRRKIVLDSGQEYRINQQIDSNTLINEKEKIIMEVEAEYLKKNDPELILSLFVKIIHLIDEKTADNDKSLKQLLPIYKDVKTQIETYNENFKDTYNESVNFFEKLHDLINKNVTLQNIEDIYYDPNNGISLHTVSPLIKEKTSEYLNKKYTKYRQFMTAIKQLIAPNRVTSNTALQKLIDDYANVENDFLGHIVKFFDQRYVERNFREILPANIDKLFSAEIKNLLLVGVNTYDFDPNLEKPNPTYEAYVYFNLIGGELNTTNINEITRKFKDEQLGTAFENMKKKNGSSFVKQPYYDLKSMIENSAKKIGGKIKRKIKKKKTKRKSNRTKYNKTRRSKY